METFYDYCILCTCFLVRFQLIIAMKVQQAATSEQGLVNQD